MSFNEFQYNLHAFEPAAQEMITCRGEYLLAVFLKVDFFKAMLHAYCQIFDSDIASPSWDLEFDMMATFSNTDFKTVMNHFNVSVE